MLLLDRSSNYQTLLIVVFLPHLRFRFALRFVLLLPLVLFVLLLLDVIFFLGEIFILLFNHIDEHIIYDLTKLDRFDL